MVQSLVTFILNVHCIQISLSYLPFSCTMHVYILEKGRVNKRRFSALSGSKVCWYFSYFFFKECIFSIIKKVIQQARYWRTQ